MSTTSDCVTENPLCKICSAELDTDPESLHYDCGGDCLWCMARVGDPECQARVTEMFLADCIKGNV